MQAIWKGRYMISIFVAALFWSFSSHSPLKLTNQIIIIILSTRQKLCRRCAYKILPFFHEKMKRNNEATQSTGAPFNVFIYIYLNLMLRNNRRNWLFVPGRISASRRWTLIILAHVRQTWIRHYTAATFRSYRGLYILHKQIYIFSSHFRFTLYIWFFFLSFHRCCCCRHSVSFLFVFEIYAISHWTRHGCILVLFFFFWPPPIACCTAARQQEERRRNQ